MSAGEALPDEHAVWRRRRPWADLLFDLLHNISRRLHSTIVDYVRLLGIGSVMPAAEEDEDPLRPWADLPLDLLRNISRRLHTTIDYVRFHATCKPWRDTLPPPPCYPAFLPWLVAPPDYITKHRKARCVFSSSNNEIRVPDRRWVISMVDGTAVSTLTTCLTGSASATPLLPFSCDDKSNRWVWVDYAVGIVSGDGTIFLYRFGPEDRSCYLTDFSAAVLRPGDGAWTMVHKQFPLGVHSTEKHTCSYIAYHDGKIITRDRYWYSYSYSYCIDTTQADDHRRWDTRLPSEHGKSLQSSYFLESQGQLLLVNVLANFRHSNTMASFVDGLSVLVHVLQDVEGGKTEWVERDSQSLIDRVMFLGRPSSFAVDAARFGMTNGGCAYFVLRSELYVGILKKSAIKQCCVFKYSFRDNRSELIEQLPSEWVNGMWLTPPQPSIASTEEIRERIVEPSYRKAAGGPLCGP